MWQHPTHPCRAAGTPLPGDGLPGFSLFEVERTAWRRQGATYLSSHEEGGCWAPGDRVRVVPHHRSQGAAWQAVVSFSGLAMSVGLQHRDTEGRFFGVLKPKGPVSASQVEERDPALVTLATYESIRYRTFGTWHHESSRKAGRTSHLQRLKLREVATLHVPKPLN